MVVSYLVRTLTGEPVREADTGWLGSDGEQVRVGLGAGGILWAVGVGERIARKILGEIPSFGADAASFDTLRRSTTSTTLRALILVAELEHPERSLASAELIDLARDLARRGRELEDLLRAIRVGYAVLAAALIDAAIELTPPSATTAEVRRISILMFELLDEFTRVGVAAFLDEEANWAAGISAARYGIAQAIIEAKPVDSAQAARVLDYPLEGHHVALIAWRHDPQPGHDLRSIVAPTLLGWGASSDALFIPVGSETIWVWGRFPSAPPPVSPVTVVPGVHIVAGEPAAGIAGFRDSHLQARATAHLVRLRSDPEGSATAHGEVDLEVMLAADPASARRFVRRHLGDLAGHDPRTHGLRTTLRRYLDLDHSLMKVAEAEHISRNTVTYRVHQAFALCGHPVGAPTTRLRTALLMNDWLPDTSP